ncbi:MAG: DUF4397 domain-containing protein [Candidatus Bipolaricaulia bacterium]
MGSSDSPGQLGQLTYLLPIALVFFFTIVPFSQEVEAATRIRFLHLAPGSGPVEIWFDGNLIEQSLSFKNSTEYMEITPEQHRVICKTKTGTNTVVLNSPFPFRKNKEYTIAVTGSRKNGDLQLVFALDNCPPTGNLAQLKFTNAVQGAPPVDLRIRYGPTLYSGLAFRTGGDCELIPPGNYSLRLVESRSGKLITKKRVELKKGTRYNIFATENKQGKGVEFVYLTKPNKPKEVPKIFGVERSVLQLFGAGLIASVVILVLGR